MQRPDLFKIALRAREFLEPLWIAAHEGWANEPVPNPPSKYMCRYSCLFLKHILKDAGYGEWQILLGRPITEELEGAKNGIFGFCAPNGGWYDHAWLIQNEILIDITADQFGGDRVVVTKSNQSIYNHNLTEIETSSDLEKLSKRVNPWIDLWLKCKK
jgi:hypothetical protein